MKNDTLKTETPADVKPLLADAVFRPILFSTPMVRAILEERKTQTRRVQGLEKFNENPDWFRYDGTSNYEDQPQFYEHFFESLDVHGEPTEKYTQVKSKVKPGDIFWVRETFEIVPIENAPVFSNETDEKLIVKYKADNEEAFKKWKPSIFMPKEACRIFLEVTDVRVERLKEISENDAISEGVFFDKDFDSYNCYLCDSKGHNAGNEICEDGFFDNAHESFRSLWKSINGADSLDKNPWVWVYEFKRIDRPSGFC